MKKIKLTKGMYAKVDDEDFETLNKMKWLALGYNKKCYAARNGKMVNGCRDSIILMHRAIMGDKKGVHYDHINGDTMDNRKENLRVATLSQNMMNRKSNKGSSSQYKGVSWYKNGGKWRAYIKLNKKLIALGYYSKEEDAALAYNKKAIELFGEYAKLNIVAERR